jgi:hypothetical protein
MYPLLLALALRHGEGRNLIFVIAGAGASFLPLLTGLVSGWQVPCGQDWVSHCLEP